MVYKFFCLLLPFFKDRTGKPAEPFYFSQDHLSRAAKSCAGVFFYRAEPANPRRKAYLNPIKQAERLAQYRVKGHCPLRVQGGARRSLPQGNLRRQAHPDPHKASRQTCAPADRRQYGITRRPPAPRDKTGKKTSKTGVLRNPGSRDTPKKHPSLPAGTTVGGEGLFCCYVFL